MKINIKAEPEFQDGMPKEVATALLADPKARRTNAFRKTCKRARETVWSSETPLVRLPDNRLYTTQSDPVGDPLAPLADKTMAQLAKWYRRSFIKRLHVLKVSQKLRLKKNLTGKAEAFRQRALGALEFQGKALDAACETLLEAINNRLPKKV